MKRALVISAGLLLLGAAETKPVPSKSRPAMPVCGGKPCEFQSAGARAVLVPIDPTLSKQLSAAVVAQVKPHWRAPSGPGSELLVTRVHFTLNSNGSLASTPVMVGQVGKTEANQSIAASHAYYAVRAIRLAAPFKLPAEHYPAWRRITLSFDRKLSS